MEIRKMNISLIFQEIADYLLKFSGFAVTESGVVHIFN